MANARRGEWSARGVGDLEGARERALEHVLIKELKLLVELRDACVRLRDDGRDVTHDVAEDGRTDEHRDHSVAALDV